MSLGDTPNSIQVPWLEKDNLGRFVPDKPLMGLIYLARPKARHNHLAGGIIGRRL